MLPTRIKVEVRPCQLDLIRIYYDLPSPIGHYPKTGDLSVLNGDRLVLTTNASYGTGAEYVRKHFGIEPEVV
jgi:hypothetical protein